MGLDVIGRDPRGDTTLSPRALVERADVLVFSTPIRAAAAIIDEYVVAAAGANAVVLTDGPTGGLVYIADALRATIAERLATPAP